VAVKANRPADRATGDLTAGTCLGPNLIDRRRMMKQRLDVQRTIKDAHGARSRIYRRARREGGRPKQAFPSPFLGRRHTVCPSVCAQIYIGETAWANFTRDDGRGGIDGLKTIKQPAWKSGCWYQTG
jgi:hypothetical protein